MNPVIRHATEVDSPTLLVLLSNCVSVMRANGIEQWDEIYPSAENIGGDITASTLHVLCMDDEIIGCVTVDDHADPLWRGLSWSERGEPFVAVHRLMVHPSQQGRGHSKRLMLHAERVALEKGCRSIRLDTFTQNPVTLALYEKLGYRRTGTVTMRKGLFAGYEKLL